MLSFIKQVIIGCFETNKRKPVPLYSQQQRLNGKIWDSQFVTTKKGAN